jgi:hypothetical protein
MPAHQPRGALSLTSRRAAAWGGLGRVDGGSLVALGSDQWDPATEAICSQHNPAHLQERSRAFYASGQLVAELLARPEPVLAACPRLPLSNPELHARQYHLPVWIDAG